MKKLFIIRHAKSDQSFFGNDFERPLNERGKQDALLMAKRFFETGITIDAFVSSPAKRAKKTAQIFFSVFGEPQDEIILISALYHAPVDVFYEVISMLPDTFNTVAIFSHNPGITHFVNSLQTDGNIDNMPTCGIFAVQINTKFWKELKLATKSFLFFDYPKNNY